MADELDVYRRQDMGARIGLDVASAVVVVDFVRGFADPEQVSDGNIGQAIARTAGLLAQAHGWPVAHTCVVYAEDGSDAGALTLKATGLPKLTETSLLSQILPDIAPTPGELVIRKR